MTDPTSTPIEQPKAPRKLSAQDKKMEADIVGVDLLLSTLLAEPADIQAELAEGGYTVEALTAAQLLQRRTFSIFVAQGEAEGAQKAATRAFELAEKSARTTYRKLRGLAKAAFLKDPDGRSQLGLAGVEPVALNNLIAAIQALIERGAKPEYAAKLAGKAVTAAKLADLNTKLTALKAANQAQEDAKRAAPVATAQRNAAAKELADWSSEFKAFAKAQFGDRPDLLKRWGLK